MDDPNVARMQSALVGHADPEIVALEARLRAAQLNADVNALDALIAESLLFTGPDGQLASKDADLEAHATGAVRFLAHEPEELLVRPIGPAAAAVALRAWLSVAVGHTLVEGHVRYTRVWAREADGAWRVVAGHVSTVPELAARDLTPPADEAR